MVECFCTTRKRNVQLSWGRVTLLTDIDTAGVYDLHAVSHSTWACVDNNSTIRVVHKGKTSVLLPSTVCQFMSRQETHRANSNQLGKVLIGDGPYLYWIAGKKDTVNRLHLRGNKIEEIPVESGEQLFQIAVSRGRIYGIRDDGFIVLVHRTGDDLSATKQSDSEQKHSTKKKEEDEDSDDDPFPEQHVPGGDWVCKKMNIPDMALHETDVLESLDPNNSSLVFGSDHEDHQAERSDLEQSKSVQKSLYRDYGAKPSKLLLTKVVNCFFRTIAAVDGYCCIVAHDGKGHCTLYVFDSGLTMKAHKSLTIQKTDYGMNTSSLLADQMHTFTNCN